MIDLVTAIESTLLRDRRRTPCYANRASSLGGDCIRELVYARLDWDKRELPDKRLLSIFHLGDVHEREINLLLARSGYTLLAAQQTLWEPVEEISGHCDGVLEDSNGTLYVLEIKSMGERIWASVARRGPGLYQWQDVARALERRPWLRRYKSQVQLYMWMLNTHQMACEDALILAVNKSTGELAQIHVPLDLDYLDGLLKRARRVNEFVASGAYPDRIPYDPEVCGRCDWLAICRPETVGKDPLLFLEKAEIQKALTVCWETETPYRAYSSASKKIKAWAKAIADEEASKGWTEFDLTLPGWLVRCRRSGTGKPVRVTWEPLGGGEDCEETA